MNNDVQIKFKNIILDLTPSRRKICTYLKIMLVIHLSYRLRLWYLPVDQSIKSPTYFGGDQGIKSGVN